MPVKWVVVAVLVALVVGMRWQRGRNRLRAARRASRLNPGQLADLGVTLGPTATLLHFSSAFCKPCTATRRILIDVAGMVEGVTYAEVDAERHLDAVRRLHIARTPTTLVLDAAGRVVVRASGQPRKPDVIAAIGRVAAG